ncbi:MAG: Flp family type IVb pilin [Pseudomonadota bacterium]
MTWKPSCLTRQSLRSLADQESGATAIEYALIMALVAMGLISGLTQIANHSGKNMGCIEQAVLEEDATEFCSNRGAD